MAETALLLSIQRGHALGTTPIGVTEPPTGRRRRRCCPARGGSSACSTSANVNGCAGPKRSPDGSDRDQRFATVPVAASTAWL